MRDSTALDRIVSRVLVFGATGALGAAAAAHLTSSGWDVDGAARGPRDGIAVDIDVDGWADRLQVRYDGVVWAQGQNAAGGVEQSTDEDFERLLDANVVFVARTLRQLIAADALVDGARGVVLSSIWQLTARADKLAYVTSKAALGGLVPAIAADLAGRFAINGVLPGVTDTPMTRAALTPEQIAGVVAATPGGRLATPEDVAATVEWLLSQSSRGVNAQWIAVDEGWSAVRSV